MDKEFHKNCLKKNFLKNLKAKNYWKKVKNIIILTTMTKSENFEKKMVLLKVFILNVQPRNAKGMV